MLIWRDRDTNQVTTIEVTVVSADRPRLFSFSWISPERQLATPTATDTVLVEFRITAESGCTRLIVSETGLDTVDHTNGWGSFLQRLRDYAERLVTQESA